MKKLILAIVIILMNLSIFAQEDAAYFVYSANVRSGPSTEFGLRGGILAGGSLTVTGKTDFDSSRMCTGNVERDNDMWLRVDFHGLEGWVQYCIAEYSGDVDTLVVANASSPFYPIGLDIAGIPPRGLGRMRITDELGQTPDTPYVVAQSRATQFIHLRATPSVDSEILDYISGDYVYVTGISGDGAWVQVEYDAKLTSCLQVNRNDDCPYNRISGWVAHYLLSFPKDWQLTFTQAKS